MRDFLECFGLRRRFSYLVGLDNRISYTVHGDAVNVAARLEQLNKNYGTYLLMDQATIDSLSLPMPVQFVDEVKIRGKERFVRVFRHDLDAMAGKQADSISS